MSDPSLWRRYRDLLRRKPAEDVDDEVRLHLQLREEEALRQGLDPAHARAAARERFGDVPGVVAELYRIDESREVRRRRAEWLSDLRRDSRFALRSLRRSPSFAVTAVVTMAIAIGANTTIFAFVNALLLEPLPYARPGELVTIDANVIGSIGEMLALRDRHTGLADIALIRPRSITYDDERDPARLDGFFVTPNLTSLLGVRPEIGRAFNADASRPGAGKEILLSHSLWSDRYGGDRRIVGRFVLVDGERCLVVGVMPASFGFPSTAARFWTPLSIDPSNIAQTWAIGNSRWIARLAPGVSADRASATIGSILPGLRHLNPLWDPGSSYGHTVAAHPLQRSLVGAERTPLILLFACVMVVLIVACVNLANLTLARVTAREREFTVRAALGGGRGRLVRQLLTESLLVALVGAAAGFGLAAVGVRFASAALPSAMYRPADARLDVVVLAFTAILGVVTGIAFGLLPALRAASAAPSTDATHLTRTGSPHGRLTSALVATEVALAVVLAITAGLLTRSFARLTDLPPGFRTDHVVTARVSPPAKGYSELSRLSAFYGALLARLSAAPGVYGVGLVDRPPIVAPVYGMAMRVKGQFEDVTRGLPTADHTQIVTPGYFAALGIPIISGRPLDGGDRAGAAPVALVSRALAKHFWPDESALGKQIGYPWASPWLTIVGVVPDVRIDSLRDPSAMAVYIPFEQRSPRVAPEMSIVIRTDADPTALERQLRDIVASIDRSVPVTAVRGMDDVIAGSVAKPRLTTLVVASFALITLLLGAVGIYGVMSYVVGQRAHELGVRMALGATSLDLARHVVGRAVSVAGAGAAAGCALSLAATRGLTSLLYGVSPTDPATFAGATLVLVAVAVVASLVPARRAMSADPVEALRRG